MQEVLSDLCHERFAFFSIFLLCTTFHLAEAFRKIFVLEELKSNVVFWYSHQGKYCPTYKCRKRL